MSDHLRLRTALAERGGVARWSELKSEVGRRAVEAACRDGIIVRIAHDTYVSDGLDDQLKVRAATGGVLSHLSAAVRHGWSLKTQPRQVDITVRPNAQPTSPIGVATRFHYRTLTPEERLEHVTEPMRTVLDCARDLAFDEGLTVADSALRANDVTRPELHAAAGTIAGAGCRRARRVLLAADERAANPLESVLRALCLQVTDLDVRPQFEIETPSQRARVDLADPARRIVIEAEGYETHGTRAGFDGDCARYTALVCDGWLVVRFTWTQVMHRPDWVLGQLGRVCEVRAADVRRRGVTSAGGPGGRNERRKKGL